MREGTQKGARWWSTLSSDDARRKRERDDEASEFPQQRNFELCWRLEASFSFSHCQFRSCEFCSEAKRFEQRPKVQSFASEVQVFSDKFEATKRKLLQKSYEEPKQRRGNWWLRYWSCAVWYKEIGGCAFFPTSTLNQKNHFAKIPLIFLQV